MVNEAAVRARLEETGQLAICRGPRRVRREWEYFAVVCRSAEEN